MHKVKEMSQSWSDIPFDQSTYDPCQDQDDRLCPLES
jgi:hypothetical protein